MPTISRAALLVSSILFILATAAGAATTTRRQYLSGTDKDHTVPWQFYCDNGQHSGAWSTIAVPSNWELQGFGIYTYGYDLNAAIRAAARGGGDRAKAEPVVHAKYKLNFSVPAEWSGNRVFLVFDGAMTDTDVSINGQSAGPIHRGGYYRFRYDVARLLKFGQDNLLEANVTDVSSDPSVNNAERHGDFWNYGGIYRPVYLEMAPNDFVDRVAVNATADGSISVDVYPGDTTHTADRVEAQLLNRDGSTFGAAFSMPFDPAASPLTLKSKFDAVKTWSAETPNLYDLRVRLLHGDSVLHELTKRIGFRTIEVRPGDGVYVNGQRVMLKGVCRHTFWPDSGRCTSPEVADLDINTIKDMNMNAVRLTHYPTDENFMDKCDEMGLYVLDELAGWHGHYDSPVGHQLVQEMVTRDVNHPCVLFWDNGNEGGWNNELNGDFDKYDPQNRNVLHPWEKFGNINTKHYPDINLVRQMAAGPDVFMPTEFNHAMYDGGGGAQLDEFWKVMSNSKYAAGGFIWAYLDEAVRRTDKNNILDSNGNEAPDGVVGPYREKEGSFYTIRQIWSPIQIVDPKLDDSFNKTLAVQNHYDFTNVADCKITWQLRHFHGMNDSTAGFDVIHQGSVAANDIAPHGVGKLTLDLPADWSAADALAVTIVDPHGREIWTWVWPIKEGERNPVLMQKLVNSPASGGTQDAPLTVLRGGAVEVAINRATLQLSSVKVNGQEISLKNGPRPLTLQARLESLGKTDANSIEGTFSSGLTMVRWTMDPSGRLRLEYQYDVAGPAPVTGVTFDYPEAKVKSKRWLGLGPYHVWGNRLLGGTLNVWENNYNDSITGQTWEYPEFKGFFASTRWMKFQTSEGAITIVPHSDDLFLRVFTPTFPVPAAALATKVAFPPGDISFLNSIPAVGAKQRKPAALPPLPMGTYGATVDFYFQSNP